MAMNKTIDELISFNVNRKLIHEDRWNDLKQAIEDLITEAKATERQAMLDALPNERDLVPQKPGDVESLAHNQFSIGFNQAISEIRSAIKLKGGSDE